LAGNAVDGSKTVHAALIYRPDVPAPVINKNDDTMLQYAGEEKWNLMVNGKTVRSFDSNELRISIVYRARCFKSEEEVGLFYNYPESSRINVEDIFSVLKTDIVTKKLASQEHMKSLSRLDLALLLMDTYIRYPYPDASKAWLPYNYCALPRLFPWTKPLLELVC